MNSVIGEFLRGVRSWRNGDDLNPSVVELLRPKEGEGGRNQELKGRVVEQSGDERGSRSQFRFLRVPTIRLET